MSCPNAKILPLLVGRPRRFPLASFKAGLVAFRLAYSMAPVAGSSAGF